ncbi:hypothetical protein BEP19_14825 [Ammoniphilus oxalaticus]|uniref:Uncharacterized protein n=1 Tax=Ammoniphilus oxalaticus TaxID=66863 RepID=A0A419SDD2_9BACL|nr:hypothetical protein [Ammoniphilus oxalaticus]RKD20957.1 hypothetical protein BEP19_14825 [Ammoniphilus oxalaticus]
MRWITRDKNGNLVKGEGDPIDSDTLFFVDENGSRAIVDGKLYVNGKLVDSEIDVNEFLTREVR